MTPTTNPDRIDLRGGALRAACAAVAFALLLLGPAVPAAHAQDAGGDDGPEITVYNDDLALVKEVRTLELTDGESVHRFTGVTTRIDATSVLFEPLQDADSISVLEQNYEFDLVNSQKLLEKYVDQRIQVSTRDGTFVGTLLSSDGANIVLQGDEGRVHMIRWQDNVTSVQYPSLPEGLLTRPTLVWLVDSGVEGPRDARVSYLTGGLSWRADYNVVLAADDTTMDVNGWVTVNNQSGATFEDALLKLVAGDVNRVRPQFREMARGMDSGAPGGGMREESFAEYHLYTLDRRTTIKDRQTKQVELLDRADVAVAKQHLVVLSSNRWRGGFNTGRGSVTQKPPVQVFLEFTNSEEAGLGLPLPAGRFRVYKKDGSGSLQFVGEDQIDHTPKNEDLRVKTGDAFDVVAESKQTDFEVRGNNVWETFEVEVRNHKDAAVTVDLRTSFWRAQNWEIVEESHEHTQEDAFTVNWQVEVPADGSVTLTYRVHHWE